MQFVASLDKKLFLGWLSAAKELADNIKNLCQDGLGVAGKIEDIYVGVLNIARLTLRLMQLPATHSISLVEKIKRFSTTANLMQQYKNDPFGIEKIKAAYATATLALTGACTAIAVGSAFSIAEVAAMTGATKSSIPASAGDSTVESAPGAAANTSAGIASREEAVGAANQVAIFLETIAEFQDEK